MEDPTVDFLGPAVIPEVFSQVAAGSTDHGQGGLVGVASLGAFPLVMVVELDFSVKTTLGAVVGLGVKFSVLDVVVDETDNGFQGFQVVAHVGNFYIGDTASGGPVLELGFKGKFFKGCDFFPDIHMEGVGIIALICDIFNGPEPILVNLTKAVG